VYRAFARACDDHCMTAFIERDGLWLRRKVRALVLNENGEVLLVRPHEYREGQWTLAGGGVEDGESPVETMRRELAEDLGVGQEAELSELPVADHFIFSDEHKAKRALDHDGQEAVMFACWIKSDLLLQLQPDEVAEAKWFAANDAYAAFPVAKQRDIFGACLRAVSRRQGSR